MLMNVHKSSLSNKGFYMTIKRINENTLSCIITPEDLHANGFKIDDFFERKKEAVDFIRSTVAQAAISENFDLAGELTTMRISVLPDHSLSLLITRETTKEGAADEVRKIAHSILSLSLRESGIRKRKTTAMRHRDSQGTFR